MQLSVSSNFILDLALRLQLIFLPVVTAVGDACILASEVLVLLVTWHATYHLKRMGDMVNVKLSTVDLLLRDGK